MHFTVPETLSAFIFLYHHRANVPVYLGEISVSLKLLRLNKTTFLQLLSPRGTCSLWRRCPTQTSALKEEKPSYDGMS